jgi:hypothetical protein
MPIDRLATKTSTESYRYYFINPEDYRRAMERAAYLESVNCPLRAWRVRLNLDGVPPTYPDAPPADKDEEPSTINRRGPNKRPLRERVRDSAAEYARRKARGKK